MISCSLCDFQAFSKGNLTFHLNSVHFKDKEYVCRLCHFKTAYKGALTRHVNSVHLRTGKTKECPICGYVTSSLLNLNSHLSVSHHLEIATAFARPGGQQQSSLLQQQQQQQQHSQPTTGVEEEEETLDNHRAVTISPGSAVLRAGAGTSGEQATLQKSQVTPPQEISQPEYKAPEELIHRYNFAHLNILYRELNNQQQHARTSAADLEERLGPRSSSASSSVRAADPQLRRSRAEGQVDFCRSREDLRENPQGFLRYPSSSPHRSPPPSPPLPPPPLPPLSTLTCRHFGPTTEAPLQRLHCSLCHFQASSPAYLKNHLRTVHLEEVHTMRCPMCEYTSDRRSDIESHIDLEHLKVLPRQQQQQQQQSRGHSVINID